MKRIQKADIKKKSEKKPKKVRSEANSSSDSREESAREVSLHRTGIVYDETNAEHYSLFESTHPEDPNRTTIPYARLTSSGLLSRCVKIDTASRIVTQDLHRVHTVEHVKDMRRTQCNNIT